MNTSIKNIKTSTDGSVESFMYFTKDQTWKYWTNDNSADSYELNWSDVYTATK